MRRWIPLLIAGLPFLGAFVPAAEIKRQAVKLDFANDVQPLLKAHCLPCHNGESSAAGLDFSTAAGIQKGGASGPAFVAGKSKTSLIVRRLRGLDGLPSMPMGFKPIDEAKIRTVERWIDGGASFSGPKRIHWAYIAPKLTAIPKPKNAAWIRNPIDAFVLGKMESKGLSPSPIADKYTLIRRVSLDLIGLPPTVAEIQAFVADKRPDAYEKLVDRLLASPHYGERQARIWLDLARYADTNGFEADRSRIMWPYRDWVIEAFNRNLPYDQFTIEQLAGDLLPNPTQDQLVATGFHRNTMFNEEGGTDAGEQLFYVLLDRVATTGTVWLGSTIGCARCHNSKYDPFSQKDHYAMLAFFAGTDAKREGDPNVGQSRFIEPTMKFSANLAKTAYGHVQTQIDRLDADLKKPDSIRDQAFAKWRGGIDEAVVRSSIKPTSFQAEGGAEFKVGEDNVVLVSGPNPEKDAYVIRLKAPKGTAAISLEAIPNAQFVNGGPGRSSSGNIVLTRFAVSENGKLRKIANLVADYIQGGYDVTELEVGVPNSGWALAPDYKRKHELIAQLSKALEAETELEIRLEFRSPWAQHGLGSFRINSISSPFSFNAFVPQGIKNLAKRSDLNESEQGVLDRFFDFHWVGRAEAYAKRRELQKQIPPALGEPIDLLVMKDKPGLTKLESPIYERGEYLSPKQAVAAATPAFLPAMPAGAPRNRLGLAKWLVSKSNPLTARVQVNRMWEQYFGRGIVESLDDLGTQSTPPTNQPLLDWLAIRFMNSGWDMKAMHRMIVTSATYRQSSQVTKSGLAKDPENIWLARGPRFRLEAETIRDNALAVSGLIDRRIGGPSVFPYQPDGIWDSPYSGERWNQSMGGERYRRGLYVFVKRTATYPSFTTLDSGTRESCLPRRIRTNTPLQALALLNDPVYFEAAKSLAENSIKQTRVSKPTGSGIHEFHVAIQHAFFRATGRPGSGAEIARLAKTFESARKRYASVNPRGANAPEFDAMVLVCNVILNLDETLTKS